MSTLQQNWRKGKNRFCLGARALREKGWWTAGRNEPNNACTYEYMNKGKKSNTHNKLFISSYIRSINVFSVSQNQ
jgi:hypothetical protein